jgi:hypothetical protein
MTLVEMLVGMILMVIMLIAVGAISDVGKQGHQNIATEASIYNDIAYGFKLIQNRIHSTNGTVAEEATSTPWIGNRLVVGNHAFGIYDKAGGWRDFVYLPDKNDENNRQTILTVLDTDAITGTFTVTGDKVDISLTGTKRKIPFNMSTTVKKRI